MIPSMTPSFVDLFSGAGGLSLGLEAAGFKSILAVDKDSWSCQTLKKNRPGTQPECLDLRNDEAIERVLKICADKDVDLIAGGPPCQGFSQIGTRLGTHREYSRDEEDPRNVLYVQFIRVVRDLQPKFVLMENVPGLLSHRDGLTVEEVRRDFKNAGYEVQTLMVDAADFGVPQHRRRAMFVGNRLGIPNPTPNSSHYDPMHPPLQVSGKTRWVTVMEALGDLPPLNAGAGRDELPASPALSASDFSELMSEKSQLWSDLRLPEDHLDRVWNHVARPHNAVDLARYGALRPGQIARDLPQNLRPNRMHIFRDKYRRQPENAPSTTVIAHLKKDGHGFIHPHQVRSLTVREAARLQSFPDWYRFYGERGPQFVQVGNAVPPLLALAIGRSILNALAKQPGAEASSSPEVPVAVS
jgi:DNA (cytosine-5)-methyltransferase 1